jgi:CRP-like cAMP-binding protein
LAAIDGGPRSANVVAMADSELAALPASAFVDLMAGHPKLALAVMRHLVALVRKSSERIMDLSVHSAQARVMTELLRMGLASSRDGESGRISPLPTHADIASRVSTTRETVARVVSDLVKGGIVRKKGHDLIIDDLDALSERVQEAPHH